MREEATISIPCPKCGHEVEKSLAWLKTNDNFTCELCEGPVEVNGPAFVKQVEDALGKSTADFQRAISDLNKRKK